jgi:hypothetical protein
MAATYHYISSQFRAHRFALERLQRFENQGATSGDENVLKDQLSDARYAADFTGRMLADCIRARGRGDPPTLVVEGYRLKLSDDGLSVVVDSRRQKRLRFRSPEPSVERLDLIADPVISAG